VRFRNKNATEIEYTAHFAKLVAIEKKKEREKERESRLIN